jgi:hypothetical protein
MDEEVHFTGLFLVDKVIKGQVSDFTGEFDRKIGGVKMSNRTNPGATIGQRVPVFF